MRERIACFVLSGGVGSRLWPLSREDNPKQFHDLAGNGSMLSKTVRRLKAREEGETPASIASERHAALVRDDLAGMDIDGAIFEPTGRNTAAAVAVAAIEALSLYGNDLVLVVPSDHEISTDHLFWLLSTWSAGRAGRAPRRVRHPPGTPGNRLRLHRDRGVRRRRRRGRGPLRREA